MAFTHVSTARTSEPTVNRRIGGDVSRNGTFYGGASTGQADAITGDLLDLKQDLVTAGWRIYGSADGAALYELSGVTGGAGGGAGGAYDVITTHQATVAGGFNVNAATPAYWWFVLQTPSDAAVQRFFIFTGHESTTTRALFRIIGCYAAPTGGSATVRPTSTDEFPIIGQTGVSSNWQGRAWGPSGSNNSSFWIIGDKDEEYAWMYVVLRSGTTLADVHAWFCYDQIDDTNINDPDPHYLVGIVASGTGTSEAYWDTRTEAEGWGNNDDLTVHRAEDDAETTVSTARVMSRLFDVEDGSLLGHFKGVFLLPQDDNGNGLYLQDGRRYQTHLSPSSEYLPTWFWVGSAAGAYKYIKGRPRGRLLKLVGSSAQDDPRIVEYPFGGQRWLLLGYWAVPWHATESFAFSV